MESRKMVLKSLFTGQQWRNKSREQTYGRGGWAEGKERVGCKERVTQRVTQ